MANAAVDGCVPRLCRRAGAGRLLRSICSDGRSRGGDGTGWIQLLTLPEECDLNVQAEEWYGARCGRSVPDSLDKMMHFEILVEDMDGAVAHAVATGATIASPQPGDRDPNELRVMLDPAGHPFCLYTS